ncbi:MAG: hypothetical protein ABJG20_01290 [Tateyamaria sp.]|uniref:hypothetical protein n=1 Tax=Tateyamaria sp. TaxID=1929288 RepID=UPI003285C500
MTSSTDLTDQPTLRSAENTRGCSLIGAEPVGAFQNALGHLDHSPVEPTIRVHLAFKAAQV